MKTRQCVFVIVVGNFFILPRSTNQIIYISYLDIQIDLSTCLFANKKNDWISTARKCRLRSDQTALGLTGFAYDKAVTSSSSEAAAKIFELVKDHFWENINNKNGLSGSEWVAAITPILPVFRECRCPTTHFNLISLKRH